MKYNTEECIEKAKKYIKIKSIGPAFGLHSCHVTVQHVLPQLLLIPGSLFEIYTKKNGSRIQWLPLNNYRYNECININGSVYTWRLIRPFVLESTPHIISNESYLEKMDEFVRNITRYVVCLELFRRLNNPQFDNRSFPFMIDASDLTNIVTPYDTISLDDPDTLVFYNPTVLGREYIYYIANIEKNIVEQRVFHEFMFCYLIKIE